MNMGIWKICSVILLILCMDIKGFHLPEFTPLQATCHPTCYIHHPQPRHVDILLVCYSWVSLASCYICSAPMNTGNQEAIVTPLISSTNSDLNSSTGLACCQSILVRSRLFSQHPTPVPWLLNATYYCTLPFSPFIPWLIYLNASFLVHFQIIVPTPLHYPSLQYLTKSPMQVQWASGVPKIEFWTRRCRALYSCCSYFS